MNSSDTRLKKSLFGATATTIAGVLLIFEILTFVSIAYFLMVPIAHRSANDLASFMIVSAHTWATIDPDKRPTFEYNLEHHSGVRIQKPISHIPSTRIVFPYIVLLRDSLAAQAQSSVTTSTNIIGGERWYWLDTIMDGKKIRFGVAEHRLGISMSITLTLIIVFVIAATLFSTFILVRRVTQPLSKLARVTSQLENGNLPPELPENGVAELASLAKSFNKMARNVSSLLANRTTLLTGIAHDLRTPLTRIRLALGLFAINKDPTPLIREIELDIAHMTCLIDESLAFGAGIEGKEKETVDINEVIRDLVVGCTHQENTISLTIENPIVIHVNVLALRRIIINLLSNALKYGNRQPINVACMRSSNLITIRIRDRGIGIPPDEQDRVFEPFYRIDKSRTLDSGGSGLGLAIAKQLADSNNWNIRLDETPGGGLTATLIIPVKN